MNMEALDFGDYSADMNAVAHDNVALFEQYEPISTGASVSAEMVAMNDELATSWDSDDCAADNLYLVPTW